MKPTACSVHVLGNENASSAAASPCYRITEFGCGLEININLLHVASGAEKANLNYTRSYAVFLLHAMLPRRHEVLRMAKEWAAMFDSYDAFKAAHPGGFYFARYEELTAGPQETRLQALAGILQALGVPQPAETTATGESESESLPLQDTQQGGNNEEKLHSRLLGYHPQQLACAFEAAKHPAIFRPSDPAGINQEFVYAADGAEALVCDVWRVVGGRAAQHGYGPYNGTVCAS